MRRGVDGSPGCPVSSVQALRPRRDVLGPFAFPIIHSLCDRALPGLCCKPMCVCMFSLSGLFFSFLFDAGPFFQSASLARARHVRGNLRADREEVLLLCVRERALIAKRGLLRFAQLVSATGGWLCSLRVFFFYHEARGHFDVDEAFSSSRLFFFSEYIERGWLTRP